ncbi:MAG: hypothetical protein WC860_00685 [Candidatus Margulisiibacteriota bacterium]|jgi:hypothetical protein
MFDNNLFEEWLDRKSSEIILKLEKEPLKSEEMMILVLKAQSNHFMHLDTDLRNDMIGLREDMKAQFEQVDKRFEQVDKRFERVYSFMKWQAGFAMTFLIAIFGALGGIYIQLAHLHP